MTTALPQSAPVEGPVASIRKRADGRWRARYRDDAGREFARHFARKGDGERWLAAQTTAVARGEHIAPELPRTTVGAFYAQWSARQIWTSGTRKAMDLAFTTSGLGPLQLGQVRPSHIETWIHAMVERGLAPGTVRTRVHNVRGVFRAAVKDRLIVSDPTDGVKLPRQRRPEAAMHLPSTRDVNALIEAADPYFRAFIALCAFAGLRLGEAAAVAAGDIDLEHHTLAVTRQVQRAGAGQVEIRPPKYGSERTVYLPDQLCAMLDAHMRRHLQPGVPGNWLFHGEPGDPPHQNTVGYWWRKTQRAAGIDAVRLHDLRHFYASGLIAAGCDVVTVQRALGHSSATVTLQTYAHLWPTAADRTRSAAAELMAATVDAGRSADFLRTKPLRKGLQSPDF